MKFKDIIRLNFVFRIKLKLDADHIHDEFLLHDDVHWICYKGLNQQMYDRVSENIMSLIKDQMRGY